MYLHHKSSSALMTQQGVKKLIRYCARVTPPNAKGKAPLHLALESGKLKVASFLLSKEANVNQLGQSDRGWAHVYSLPITLVHTYCLTSKPPTAPACRQRPANPVDMKLKAIHSC